jgi:hypothetical protein
LRINYIFNGNEEDEDDDIGGPLVRNKSDWIPKPTKDTYLEESINTLKRNSLETNKHVKDNLCRNERQALFRLKSDKSIVIKEADKGNAVVILDREYYRAKILDMLKDGMYYGETDKKADQKTYKMITKLLHEHEGELHKEEIDYTVYYKFYIYRKLFLWISKSA